MVNYVTAAGVQNFSITIASGSTTGTATISAVGSGAFILYGGTNPSVTSNAAQDLAYLTLTNSTTITATRNDGTTGTVVITGCIVDGDTTNLIKSVQFGTASIPSSTSTGTATISAVTNANTAIAFLGVKDPGASFAPFKGSTATVSLSGTTVTATRGSTAAFTVVVVGFCVIEFQGSALTANAVQNLSVSTAATTASWTATITSVTTGNAVSIFGGSSTTLNSIGSQVLFDGVLTNSTTFTANVNSSASGTKVVNASIVEFNSGVLNSAVQRSTTTLTAATSNTSTITSVAIGNSGISFLGNTSTAGDTSANETLGAVALTNGTTVTTTKNSATNNITASWEVFEFPAPSGGEVITCDKWLPSIEPFMQSFDVMAY